MLDVFRPRFKLLVIKDELPWRVLFVLESEGSVLSDLVLRFRFSIVWYIIIVIKNKK